jgi:xanthine dehydrogenase YagR molybdenum-binding subunit
MRRFTTTVNPVAVVVAKTLDDAKAAATLLKFRYAAKAAQINLMDRLGEARLPKNPGKEPAQKHRGDLQAAFAKSAAVIENTYITPIQHHNPMEPHATIAWWAGEKLTLFDATQYITGVRMSLAETLDVPLDYVRVINPVVGGGFGSKGSMWSHVPLCAMAAKVTGKPGKAGA